MRRLRYLLAGAGLLAVLALPSLAAADANDFVVTDFQADETLTRQDPQGELHVVEHINVTFSDSNHGILRAIPASYKGHSLQLHINGVSSTSGAPAQYSTYGSNGNTVLKIGDPDRTVTGPQEYTVDYTLRNVITFYKDHDELYWDVNGDQWQQPFSDVAVTLHLPPGLQQSRNPVCYAGSAAAGVPICTVSGTGSTVRAATTQDLSAGQTLTYVAGFKTGYFHPYTWRDDLSEHIRSLAEFFGPLVLLGGGGFIYWMLRGRDPKGRGVIIPEYDAPDGLKPIQVGALTDFAVDNRDITATLIGLAVRGYIKIIETKQAKHLQKDTVSYSLQLVNTDFSQLDNYEKILMTALFANPTAGATVDVSTLKNQLYETAKTLNGVVEGDLTSQGYFRGDPLSSGKGVMALLIGFILLLFYFGHFLGAAAAAGCVIGAVIALLFVRQMAARSAKGVAAKEHIEGLKLYLEVAEKDRLNKLQGPDAAYAENSQEPVKTVALFEKLLPYAMVLGVEKAWATKFNDLYTSPPSWYSGNWAAFNAGYLVGSLNDGMGTAVNSAFSAPSSSGSSGFGGGFAGGGGGGGGGGGW